MAARRRTPFRDEREFRRVMDATLALLAEDPRIGPRLRDADLPQRFEFPDLGAVLHVRPADADADRTLEWVWGRRSDWPVKVWTTLDSEVANRYLQGRENLAMAVSTGRIRVGGDARGALTLVPVVRGAFARYRDMVARDHPHLLVTGPPLLSRVDTPTARE